MTEQPPDKKILLVEDDAIIALTEKMLLEKNGYSVITAHTGEKAVEMAATVPGIDLVLMDIDLGSGIDGTMAAEKILADRDLPVVFLSSHTEQEVVEKTGKITSYGYVVKNSGETVLLTSIGMAFRLFDAKQEAAGHEKRLLETTEHLKEAQEIALLGRWDYYHASDRLEWSDSIYTMFEVDRDSFGASIQSFMEAIHPDDREMVQHSWEQSLVNQSPYMIEHRIVTSGNSTRWVLEKCRTIFDSFGKPLHSIGVVQDITERKESESVLRDILEELKKSQKVAHVGNWIWHIPENRLEWSDQMYTIFGIEKDKFTGNLADVIAKSIHPDDRLAVEESNSSVVNSNRPIPVEYRIIRPDGTVRTVWAEAGELETDSKGKPKLLRGIVHDITERKRIEESLQKSEIILSESERLTQSGGWEWNIENDIFTLTKGWLQIHGCSTPRLSRQEMLPIAHPDDKAQVEDAFRRAVDENIPYDLEHRIIRQDNGQTRMVHSYGEVIRDAVGKPQRMYGAVLDISEQKAKEEQITNLLREKELILKESHHRIKNHYLIVEALLRQQADNSDSPDAGEILRDAASRILGMHILYEKLLKDDAYKQVAVRSYLEDLGSSVMNAYDSGKITLETFIEDLSLDTEKVFPLGAIAVELMTNSLKYAFSPGDTGTLTIRLEGSETEWLLSVSDNGRGLDEGFDAGVTGHFGLLIVKMMAKQIGGSFSMESEPGRGTRSCVRFTLKKSPDSIED